MCETVGKKPLQNVWSELWACAFGAQVLPFVPSYPPHPRNAVQTPAFTVGAQNRGRRQTRAGGQCPLNQLSPSVCLLNVLRSPSLMRCSDSSTAQQQGGGSHAILIVGLTVCNAQARMARRSMWGWKSPRSIYYLPFYKEIFGSKFRYVHVVYVPPLSTRYFNCTPTFPFTR